MRCYDGECGENDDDVLGIVNVSVPECVGERDDGGRCYGQMRLCVLAWCH